MFQCHRGSDQVAHERPSHRWRTNDFIPCTRYGENLFEDQETRADNSLRIIVQHPCFHDKQTTLKVLDSWLRQRKIFAIRPSTLTCQPNWLYYDHGFNLQSASRSLQYLHCLLYLARRNWDLGSYLWLQVYCGKCCLVAWSSQPCAITGETQVLMYLCIFISS